MIEKIILTIGFITDIKDMDGLVYYARPDLKLGAGFGTAISIQGGPKVQEELKKIGSANVTEVVVTGGRKPSNPIHPPCGRSPVPGRGQEEKLKATTLNVLRKAEEHKLQKIVFPAMGAGFYGIPLEVCARVPGRGKGVLGKSGQFKGSCFLSSGLREIKLFRNICRR